MSGRHSVWFERAIEPELRDRIAERLDIVGETGSIETLGEACGAVVGAWLFDGATMDRAPGLRVIARTGIGVDRVDLREATRRGIVVCNAPDGPTVPTAEHAVALMLAVGKRLRVGEERLKAGEKDLYARHHSFEFAGATLGLVGFGRIARRVARTARGLDMEVMVYDPYVNGAKEEYGFTPTLEGLLAAADVISVHVPLSAETEGMFGADRFGGMKTGAIFINTARGGLVDQPALLEAVESGKLFGAGLDVTEPEPLDRNDPLLTHPHVVVTPHVASATPLSRRRMFETALAEVERVLNGTRPVHPVNLVEGGAKRACLHQ